MHSISSLAELLIQDKSVSFSFLLAGSSEERSSVAVRECHEGDLVEYGIEFEQGEMFEVAPGSPKSNPILTNLGFASFREAGNAVLRERAAITGSEWNDA
jgi:hypothetical protein